MDLEQKHHQESLKEIRKNDRRLKELILQSDEDKKGLSQLKELADKYHNKLRVYKKQLDEAEEIAAINLGKLRKTQLELENAEERAEQTEKLLCKVQVKQRKMNSPQVI